jgi:1-phosphofructokinase
VVVFAPLDSLAVTVEQPTGCPELHVHAAGQGMWQARVLAALGLPVTVCTSVGGVTGELLRCRLEADGVEVAALARDAPTGWYVSDRRDAGSGPLAGASGVALSADDSARIHELALRVAEQAAVVILAGPMDQRLVRPDLYPCDAVRVVSSGVAGYTPGSVEQRSRPYDPSAG